jgi:hypothetical protein
VSGRASDSHPLEIAPIADGRHHLGQVEAEPFPWLLRADPNGGPCPSCSVQDELADRGIRDHTIDLGTRGPRWLSETTCE